MFFVYWTPLSSLVTGDEVLLLVASTRENAESFVENKIATSVLSRNPRDFPIVEVRLDDPDTKMSGIDQRIREGD